MGGALTIKQAAEVSGFTPVTLRYYEHIGLLPEAPRTAAGYRQYDQRTLDRLAFIARAKQLGCTLEEIATLLTAWEGGRCGPIQDELRRIVSDKVATARDRIAELEALTAELRGAAAALERHRSTGRCDDSCGCVSSPPATSDEAAIGCTLAAGSMDRRFHEWHALLDHVQRRASIDGGIRVEFAPPVPVAELVRLATAEQECCTFFRFAITVDARGVALEVRAPDDAGSIVDALFGTVMT